MTLSFRFFTLDYNCHIPLFNTYRVLSYFSHKSHATTTEQVISLSQSVVVVFPSTWNDKCSSLNDRCSSFPWPHHDLSSRVTNNQSTAIKVTWSCFDQSTEKLNGHATITNVTLTKNNRQTEHVTHHVTLHSVRRCTPTLIYKSEGQIYEIRTSWKSSPMLIHTTQGNRCAFDTKPETITV